MSGPGPVAAAWAWADHLRAGGTTPWLEWLEAADVADHDPSRGAAPGAAQLEFVRRLALRRTSGAGRDAQTFADFADLILGRSGPGRGPAHLPLVWPGEQPRTVGAPPVDPARIPADELCRVGVGTIAELLVRAPEPPAPTAVRRPRRRPWRRAFHLAGAPTTVARVREALAAAGHAEGGRSPEVVLLAEPFDEMLAQVWSSRVQHGASVRWVTFAGRWARREQLPPSADLPRIAAGWARRVGAQRVHVVSGPDPVRATADLLGLTPGETAPTVPRSLSPASVDTLRRLNSVLHVRVPRDRLPAYVARAAELLPEVGADTDLAIPAAHRGWADARARRITEDLRAGGYAVHGDLDRIAPRHGGAPHPRTPDVLDVVLATCLRAAELTA